MHKWCVFDWNPVVVATTNVFLSARQFAYILFRKMFLVCCFNRSGSVRSMFLEIFGTRYFYKHCIDNHVFSLSACEKLARIFLIGTITLTGN